MQQARLAHSKGSGVQKEQEFEGGVDDEDEIACDVSRHLEGGNDSNEGSHDEDHSEEAAGSAMNNEKVSELKNGKLVPINHVHLKTFAARSANFGKKKQRK